MSQINPPGLPLWTPPPYGYQDGEWVECRYDPANPDSDRWVRVYIILRTAVYDLGMRRVPVYQVEDRQGTRWIVGEGELRRIR